jgi:hypothetical protein
MLTIHINFFDDPIFTLLVYDFVIFELQPGLYLLGSKLGWIITGRTSERSDEIQEQSLLTLNFRTSTHSSFVVTVVDQSLPVKPPLEDF